MAGSAAAFSSSKSCPQRWCAGSDWQAISGPPRRVTSSAWWQPNCLVMSGAAKAHLKFSMRVAGIARD
ncbi:MAG: hypothetical protein AMJ84_06560 [Acidithiobacillales bacterium SM23_46]|nr:MAG: hypothetical protein AMJ84_06560 [Acidithiobacillales bacterium SM23_46]